MPNVDLDNYAAAQGFQRRGRLLAALEEHPDRRIVEEWLLQNGGPWWQLYLRAETPDSPAGEKPSSRSIPPTRRSRS